MIRREASRVSPDGAGGPGFPVSAGLLLGLGLGGFFDGMLLHQVLQWHHMATSAGYPADSVQNLQLNTLLDGLFHVGTYLLVVIGLAVMWRAARQPHPPWSSCRSITSTRPCRRNSGFTGTSAFLSGAL